MQLIKQEIEKQYGIGIVEIENLGERDSQTYKITTRNQVYLLKRHNNANNRQVISSELEWILHINRHTNIPTQIPVENNNGEWVSSLEGHKGLWTLQRWLEGENLTEQPSEKQMKKIAELLANLHEASKNFVPSVDFSRLLFDIQHLRDTVENLTTKDILTRSEKKKLKLLLPKMEAVVAQQSKGKDGWGVIHSDLHNGNYIVKDAHVLPIDFSCCGEGYFLFDLAETLLDLSSVNRQRLIAFYQTYRNIPVIKEEVMETFFLWQVLRNIDLLSDDPKEDDHLKEEIPYAMGVFVGPYLEGKRFML